MSLDFFKPEYIVSTVEKRHDPYRVIIHTYDTTKISGKNTWNFTEGKVYKGENLIGSIKRDYSHFPYIFFKRENKDYFISGSSYMSITILDCQTGKIFETSTGYFCPATYHIIDQDTLCILGCVWGGPCFYQFYDMTDPNNSCNKLDLDTNIPKYDYVLMNHDVGEQKNCLKPVVDGNKIIFERRQARVKDGEKDMEELEYKYELWYEQESIESIRKKSEYNDKIYYIPMSRIVLCREDNRMKLVEFWRSKEQIKEDQENESSD